VADTMIEGKADLATMHASDAIINLVADGYAADPQPWARNDMVIAGPASDPAGIRGEKDAVKALRQIIGSGSYILVHASAGASEVLHDLLVAGQMELDPERTISLPTDRHRQMLERAIGAEAYTIVGRIPFLNAKIPRGGAEIMVQGDPRLRRPYLVVTADRQQDDGQIAAAREFVSFLRSKEAQGFIAEFGRGHLDDRPLFFPVATEPKR
jgi:tungstate transport system substrate-binding protein